ncbi:hypothetical protein NWE73_06350 [Bdellovibrio sp. PAP01]|uniref:Uncharacterized protein n=1 Tax=Bdellovibrio svalbardensis TaxID=2972972 RepID=A0ABT6DJ77_9BACT|nr:hypothetical protein [Bdellovibrio svalbardensis]
MKFGTFLLGCSFCFFLQSQYQLTAVVAAALTGFLGSFIPDTKRIESTHVHATIYMGAFVAMGSRVVNAGPGQILLVSFLGSSIYFFMSPYFKGLGGRLGLIAFISSLLGVAIRFWG